MRGVLAPPRAGQASSTGPRPAGWPPCPGAAGFAARPAVHSGTSVPVNHQKSGLLRWNPPAALLALAPPPRTPVYRLPSRARLGVRRCRRCGRRPRTDAGRGSPVSPRRGCAILPGVRGVRALAPLRWQPAASAFLERSPSARPAWPAPLSSEDAALRKGCVFPQRHRHHRERSDPLARPRLCAVDRAAVQPGRLLHQGEAMGRWPSWRGLVPSTRLERSNRLGQASVVGKCRWGRCPETAASPPSPSPRVAAR